MMIAKEDRRERKGKKVHKKSVTRKNKRSTKTHYFLPKEREKREKSEEVFQTKKKKSKRKREKNRSREKARAFLTTNNNKQQHQMVFSLLHSFCFDGAFRAAL